MIYTVENTVKLGKRVKVLVDGVEVNKVFYVDTKKGKVRHYDTPVKVHKHGKRAISRTKYGRRVEVIDLES